MKGSEDLLFPLSSLQKKGTKGHRTKLVGINLKRKQKLGVQLQFLPDGARSAGNQFTEGPSSERKLNM